MLDLGFLEVMLVCVIALIVLGPERLPTLMRSVGHWLGRGRAVINQVKDQLEVEARNLDMKARRELIQREFKQRQEENKDDSQEWAVKPESKVESQ